ncbi:hypothetical protein D3C74_304840 [compost metagenome]
MTSNAEASSQSPGPTSANPVVPAMPSRANQDRNDVFRPDKSAMDPNNGEMSATNAMPMACV